MTDSLFKKLRHSLTTRLLLLFVLTSLLMVGLLVGSLIHAIGSQWRHGIAPHIEQYLDYVNADLGYPPSQQRAIELAEKLPLNIYIQGPGVNFSTGNRVLDLEDLEFRDRRYPNRKRHHSGRIDIGEHNDRTVLRNRTGEYRIYYEVQHHNSRNRGKDFLWIPVLCLGLILGGCYLILRRMLRPVQDIKQAVHAMGAGQLDTRVPVRSQNDLGSLAGSINTMAEDIESLLDAKRQLLLGASHELRTPITRAKIATQLLDDSENRKRIIEDLDEMESLIGDIIESERVTGGHSALNLSEINLTELLSTLIQDLHENIETDFSDKLPTIKADAVRLRLLFRNLINNALQHGANDKPPILKTSFDGTSIKVSVRDFGEGISAEHLDKLTEPFYRTDASRTRATGGFGLGLHIVDLIVKAHGATLSIDSPPSSDGKSGTKVTVILPRR